MKESNNSDKSDKAPRSQNSPLGDRGKGGPAVLYIDTAYHNVPTFNQHLPIKDELSRNQVLQLIDNCAKRDIELYGLEHPFQGIVCVIGPELLMNFEKQLFRINGNLKNN